MLCYLAAGHAKQKRPSSLNLLPRADFKLPGSDIPDSDSSGKEAFLYRPRSKGDNAFGSVRVFVCVCVCPSSPV